MPEQAVKDERTPLAGNPAGTAASNVIQTAVLALLMISLSVGLINFNKWLMHEGRFPYAMPLIFVQMCISSAVSMSLFMVRPSMFPALCEQGPSNNTDLLFYVKRCVPVALAFTVGLILGNVAYMYCGIAFLQMVKESNLIWTFMLAVLFRMETFSWGKAQVLVAAVAAMMLTVKGEMHFNNTGFLLQFAAILCEALRIVLQSKVLSGKKLDPMSYVLLVSPLSSFMLAVALGFYMVAPHASHAWVLPPLGVICQWAPVLAANGCVALALNLTVAGLVKAMSPVSYLMCQLLKDIMAMTISIIFLQNTVSKMQWCGFSVQLSCVFAWSLLKNYPEKFDEGWFSRCSHRFSQPVPSQRDVKTEPILSQRDVKTEVA